MICSRTGLLLSAIAVLVALPALSHAQDTVPTHTIKMVMVRADLSKTLDAKKAKQGDPVEAKLMYEAQIPDSSPLPRNTVLSGHVDSVQASEDKGNSYIQITFDKAVLKSGKTIPIKATIMNIKALESPFVAAEKGQESTGQSIAKSGPQEMTGGVRQATGSSSAYPGRGPKPATNASADANEDQDSSAAIKTTNVRGVTLQSNLQQSSSGTFQSSGRNVRISGGTEIDIAIGEMPAKTPAQ